MWTVIYMAHNKNDADSLRDILTKEGFLVKLKPVYKNVDERRNCYQILVPQTESEEAQEVIMKAGY
ncbi:MAG: hypothetical protein PHP06_04910 [Clostridia bacterium]|nr:hypothetical protein [Clostridia bacterium]